LQTNSSGKNSGSNLKKARSNGNDSAQEVDLAGSKDPEQGQSAEEDVTKRITRPPQGVYNSGPVESPESPEVYQGAPQGASQTEIRMTLDGGIATDTQPKDAVGAIVDQKYELLALLGTGGMSAVYKAKHLLTRKTVAVKLLHPRLLNDPQSLRRFQHEARAAGRLNHPHAISVHDLGLVGDQPYIIMDYLEGVSFAELIKREGRVGVHRCLHIFIQACEALADAHKHGIVHRDLKPGNIMLVKDGEDPDFVKVVDFGIAKIVSEGGESLKLTSTGDVFGSPLYMSPEQCLGGALDARSDIYSMGIVMYEALTGKAPFAGNNVMETILKQTSEPPPGLGAIEGDVRLIQKLDAIILKCLAKEPAARYQSMQDLKADLESVARSGSTGWKPLAKLSRKASQLERAVASKLGSSRKTFLFKVACWSVGFLVVICAVAAWLLWPAYGPENDPSIGERELTLKPVIFNRGPVSDTSGEPASKLAMRMMDNPAQAEDVIRYLFKLGNKYKDAGDYYQACIKYKAARDLIVKYNQYDMTVLCAEISLAEAESQLMLGRADDMTTRHYCEYAIARLEKLGQMNTRDGLMASALMGQIFTISGDQAAAAKAFARYVQIFGFVWNNCSDADLALTQSYAADFYRKTGDFVQSRSLYFNAIPHWQGLSRFDNAVYNRGVVECQLSMVLRVFKQFAPAEEYWNKAREDILAGGGNYLDQAKLEYVLSDLRLAEGDYIEYLRARARARKLWTSQGRGTAANH
jgi:serine/threonine protein kinase